MAEEGENKKNAMVIANGRLICCDFEVVELCVGFICVCVDFVFLLFCSESLTLAIFNGFFFCVRTNAVGSWTQTIPTLFALRIGKRKRID